VTDGTDLVEKGRYLRRFRKSGQETRTSKIIISTSTANMRYCSYDNEYHRYGN